MKSDKFFNMVGIINAIAGDIIGSTYEWKPTRTKDYNFPLLNAEQTFTDDTVHTLAVADWLLNTDRSHKALTEKIVDWSSRYNVGYGHMFRKWLNSDNHDPYGSFGNGSAMRVSPVAWVATSEEECLELAKKSAEVTHNHPEGIKGAQAVALAIWMNRQKKYNKEDIKNRIMELFGYNLNIPYDDIKPDYKFDSTCQGSVPESIICWLESTDYEDCIRKAVSMGGDADTMACIAGSICGANDETCITLKLFWDVVTRLHGDNDVINMINEFNLATIEPAGKANPYEI